MQATMSPSSLHVCSPSQVSLVVECASLIPSFLPFSSTWPFPSSFLGKGGGAVAGTGGGGAVTRTGGGGAVAGTGGGVLVILLFVSFWFSPLLFSTLGKGCGVGTGGILTSFFFSSPAVLFGSNFFSSGIRES